MEEINQGIVRSYDVNIDGDYVKWIQEVKQRFRNAQIKTAIRINSEQLYFNWCMGRDLMTKRAEEKWGKGVVEQISLDLQAAFPGLKGFSVRNLWYMKNWYQFYAEKIDNQKLHQLGAELHNQKLQQPGGELHIPKLQQVAGEIEFPSIFAQVPWKHHVLIIQRCSTVDEALFYIKRTITEGLSRSALDNYLRADLYHTAGAAETNFASNLPEAQSRLAQGMLKGNYDLGFISLPADYDEAALEDAIEKRMTRFLLELGNGWAFVGRQKEIIVSGKTRRIDLLFYHIYLRCYVVLELKVKPFEPEFAGKLNFYVNVVNEFVRRESDNPTLGLLICKDMDRLEVRLAFQGTTTPMGVATYDNIKIADISKQLPTPEQIRQQIEIAEEEFRSAHLAGT